MAKPVLDDALWAIIEPLLPEPKARRFRFPGCKPMDNRRALTGIIFVLKTGIGRAALRGGGRWDCVHVRAAWLYAGGT